MLLVSGFTAGAGQQTPTFTATQLYQIIRIDGDQLHYQARAATGRFYDGFTLIKRDGRPNQLIEKVPNRKERRRLNGNRVE